MNSLKNAIPIILVSLISTIANAQYEVVKPSNLKLANSESSKLEAVEIHAEFPGGLDSLKRFMSNNLTYPQVALDNDQSGTVEVEFVVTETGALDEIRIVSSPGMPFSKEGYKLVKSMPNWLPANQNGKNVKSYFTLPIIFEMEKPFSFSYINSFFEIDSCYEFQPEVRRVEKNVFQNIISATGNKPAMEFVFYYNLNGSFTFVDESVFNLYSKATLIDAIKKNLKLEYAKDNNKNVVTKFRLYFKK